MREVNEVEAVLARLMPVALSDEGQQEMERLLDELAGDPSAIPVRARWKKWLPVSGIAAAGVGMALGFLMKGEGDGVPPAVVRDVEARSGLLLVGGSNRIEAMSEEGWSEDPDGSAMRAVRLLVVEENSFLDEETGIVMQVSEPREEMVLMPISAF